MLPILTKCTWCRYTLFLLAAILFFSCQKTLDFENVDDAVTVDVSTKINSTVSGFVTDENNASVMGAIVQFGTSISTTDKYGYFEAKNVQVIKNAAFVTVTKPGYFKGIKTFMAVGGESAFFRIKLMPKTTSGNINAATGGTVTLSNGLSIKLPAGGTVNAATNSQYTGTVKVSAYWISPTAADLAMIMPGDLRGINTEGSLKLLQTFGMAAVELTGSSGELLQIVNGQKATLTFPIPSSLLAAAPTAIPLWYFDETNGLWKQEGTATKTGNTYIGDVGHFSFWNCDVPENFVQFNCSLKKSVKEPLAFTLIKITVAGTNNFKYGYTNASGNVDGLVPANSNLIMEVFPAYGCNTPLYSQTFIATNANISLGTIIIPNLSSIATLNGTVTNCGNTAVNNGFIVLKEGDVFTRHPVDNAGAYSISKFFCSFPQTVTLIAEDITNAQQSAFTSKVINTGINTVSNIQACGVSTQQFINYTINNVAYSYTAPADTFSYFNDILSKISMTAETVPASGQMSFGMSNAAINTGSNQNLLFFYPAQIFDSMSMNAPISVYISEYGPVSQFVAGSFTGTFTGKPPTNTAYNATCNFRIRRRN
jgi:hypothetical protein